jgi:type III restriction enzyme
MKCITSKNVQYNFDYIQNKLNAKLTKKTIVEIVKRSGRMADILKNPQMFLSLAVNKINSVINELTPDGIKHEKLA